MKLVGLVGLRRSGKDTAADALVDLGYENVKFAGALKAMLKTYLRYVGVPESIIYDVIEGFQKETPVKWFEGNTTRFAMQTLGTEWGRDLIGESIWIHAAIDRARQFEKVVISDVRFPNEVDAVRNAGGKIVKIYRPGLVVDSHLSESLIAELDYDFEIANDSTIEVFQEKVRHIIPNL
jgi:rhodanese-related sulfurtransferase